VADLVKITITENGPLTAKLGLTVETLAPGEERRIRIDGAVQLHQRSA